MVMRTEIRWKIPCAGRVNWGSNSEHDSGLGHPSHDLLPFVAVNPTLSVPKNGWNCEWDNFNKFQKQKTSLQNDEEDPTNNHQKPQTNNRLKPIQNGSFKPANLPSAPCWCHDRVREGLLPRKPGWTGWFKVHLWDVLRSEWASLCHKITKSSRLVSVFFKLPTKANRLMDWLQQYPTSFFTNKRSNKQNWEHQWNLAVFPRDKSYQSFPQQTGFCFHDPNPIVGENFHNPEDLAKCFCWVGCHLCLLPNVFFGNHQNKEHKQKRRLPTKTPAFYSSPIFGHSQILGRGWSFGSMCRGDFFNHKKHIKHQDLAQKDGRQDMVMLITRKMDE